MASSKFLLLAFFMACCFSFYHTTSAVRGFPQTPVLLDTEFPVHQKHYFFKKPPLLDPKFKFPPKSRVSKVPTVLEKTTGTTILSAPVIVIDDGQQATSFSVPAVFTPKATTLPKLPTVFEIPSRTVKAADQQVKKSSSLDESKLNGVLKSPKTSEMKPDQATDDGPGLPNFGFPPFMTGPSTPFPDVPLGPGIPFTPPASDDSKQKYANHPASTKSTTSVEDKPATLLATTTLSAAEHEEPPTNKSPKPNVSKVKKHTNPLLSKTLPAQEPVIPVAPPLSAADEEPASTKTPKANDSKVIYYNGIAPRRPAPPGIIHN